MKEELEETHQNHNQKHAKIHKKQTATTEKEEGGEENKQMEQEQEDNQQQQSIHNEKQTKLHNKNQSRQSHGCLYVYMLTGFPVGPVNRCTILPDVCPFLRNISRPDPHGPLPVSVQ